MKFVLSAVVLIAGSIFALVGRSAHIPTVAPAQNAQPPAQPPAKPDAKPEARPAQPSHPVPAGQPGQAPPPPLDWKALEAPVLTNHVQLTSRDKFVKAGEAYFSPDSKWIIFQAVAVPQKGQEPAPFYSMYVAKVKHDAAGRINGLEESILISPPGSANTCGWFHPSQKARVLYGSTLTRPSENQPSGFQVGSRNYRWAFPTEMEVVTQAIEPMAVDYGLKPGAYSGANAQASRVFSREGYDAECSYSADGRFILYTHVENKPAAEGKGTLADADIWLYDVKTVKQTPLVVAEGYDGGPFFSPDGKRLCYRSDRKHNDLLQVFICDLVFDKDGVPTGTAGERNLTNNQDVNWAPFWHPSGNFLIFGTSQMGHTNYEVFAVEVPGPGSVAAAAPRQHRVTSADGADVLPVFSPDGRYMMWTSQRGPKVEGEQRPSSQLWAAEWADSKDLFK